MFRSACTLPALFSIGLAAAQVAPPPPEEALRRLVEVVPEFPNPGCGSGGLEIRASLPAGSLAVGEGRFDQPVAIALEVQPGPSFRLGTTVINWIQAARGSLTLGRGEQARRLELSSYPFGAMATLTRFRPAEQRLVVQLPVRLQPRDEAPGHGVLILKGEYREGAVIWRWAGFLFEELVQRHFPAAVPVRQLLGLPAAAAGNVAGAAARACCFFTACCVCRNHDRCARGDCGFLCPECVLTACNECSEAECHDRNCSGCDLG